MHHNVPRLPQLYDCYRQSIVRQYLNDLLDTLDGRMFSVFAGTDLAVEFMPVTVSGFSLINTFQLMSITDAPRTVTRQYWTSASTGTKHMYDIYKVYI